MATITYVTARIPGQQPKFMALQTVSHTEALGILDPFQRWDNAECPVCGDCNSYTYARPDDCCPKADCNEAMYASQFPEASGQ